MNGALCTSQVFGVLGCACASPVTTLNHSAWQCAHAHARAHSQPPTHTYTTHQFCAQRAVLDQDTPPARPSADDAAAAAGAGEHVVDNETGNVGDVTREAVMGVHEQWQTAGASRQGHRNEHAARQDVAHVRALAAAGKLHMHPTFCFEGAELAQVCWSQCV